MDEIRRLTDWQIHNLIFLPALRAAAKRDRASGSHKGRKRRKTRLPTKEEYFLVGEKMGVSRDHMEREWAEQNGKPEQR